jgi:hypothetical protein
LELQVTPANLIKAIAKKCAGSTNGVSMSKKKETKFKVGDRVKCIDPGSYLYGYVGTIEKISDNKVPKYRVEFRDYNLPVTFSELNLELFRGESEQKANESELERLVRVANEGRIALNELKAKYRNAVVFDDGVPLDGFKLSERNLVVKPKPTFEPFYVGPEYKKCSDLSHTDSCLGDSAWKVELKGDVLHVGCREFNAYYAKRALQSLLKDEDTSYTTSGIEVMATRSGIGLRGEGKISWADADRILEALEKAGV